MPSINVPSVLLERAALERLYVHILNGALFALVLQLLDQRQWLEDPRVELMYAGDHADIYTPFFALPAEMPGRILGVTGVVALAEAPPAAPPASVRTGPGTARAHPRHPGALCPPPGAKCP